MFPTWIHSLSIDFEWNCWPWKLQKHRHHFTPKSQATLKEELQLNFSMELREQKADTFTRISSRLEQVIISSENQYTIENFLQGAR